MSKRDAYKQKADAMLEEWENKVESLKIKARAADADAKIVYYDKIDDLQAQKSAVEERLNDLTEAGETAWEEIAHGIDNALTDLDKSTHNAIQQFK